MQTEGKHEKQYSFPFQVTVNIGSQEGGQCGFKVLKIQPNP